MTSTCGEFHTIIAEEPCIYGRGSGKHGQLFHHEGEHLEKLFRDVPRHIVCGLYYTAILNYDRTITYSGRMDVDVSHMRNIETVFGCDYALFIVTTSGELYGCGELGFDGKVTRIPVKLELESVVACSGSSDMHAFLKSNGNILYYTEDDEGIVETKDVIQIKVIIDQILCLHANGTMSIVCPTENLPYDVTKLRNVRAFSASPEMLVCIHDNGRATFSGHVVDYETDDVKLSGIVDIGLESVMRSTCSSSSCVVATFTDNTYGFGMNAFHRLSDDAEDTFIWPPKKISHR